MENKVNQEDIIYEVGYKPLQEVVNRMLLQETVIDYLTKKEPLKDFVEQFNKQLKRIDVKPNEKPLDEKAVTKK